MMEEIRDAIDAGSYKSYKEEKLYGMNQINREKEAQISFSYFLLKRLIFP